MKRIIVFRHTHQEKLGLAWRSWWLPARLTKEGKELAREIARRYRKLLEGCAYFFTSPLVRSQETLFEMMEELGHPIGTFDNKVKFYSSLYTPHPEGWLSDDPDETVGLLWKKHSYFVENEGKRILESIIEIASDIPNGERALCISHAGLLDGGLAYAKILLGTKNAFEQIQDIKRGEGVIFYLDKMNLLNLELKKVEELRF